MLRKTTSQLRAAATFGFLLLASPLVIGGPAAIVRNFTVDDTYYYLQIARNLADGYGSTFDRVSATNGFQLAWQGFLVPLAFVFRGRDALLEAMFIAVCALVAVAAYTLARLCASRCDDESDRRLAAFFALGAVVLVAFSPLTGLLTGMESALTFLVLVLFAAVAPRPRRSGRRGRTQKGLVLRLRRPPRALSTGLRDRGRHAGRIAVRHPDPRTSSRTVVDRRP